jgi:hypothetical protein
MRVYLHIGTDKTGSTSLQRSLYRNRDWLLRKSFYVPTTGLGRNNGHSELLSSSEQQSWDEFSDELLTAGSAGYQNAIVSWEGMAAYGKQDIAHIYQYLKDFQVAVVVYLREQADILQTGHLQQVKSNRNSKTIADLEFSGNWIRDAQRALYLKRSRRNYYLLLRCWEKTLPDATFYVRIYDRNQLVGADITRDFLDVLGLSIDSGFVPAERVDNPSIDAETALFIESLQKSGESVENIARLTDIAESRIRLHGSRSKYFFSTDTVNKTRRLFASSNRKVASRYLHTNDELFPDKKNCWRADAFAELEKRAADLAEQIREVDRIPTLIGVTEGERIPADVSLVSGWCQPNRWGVWSKGNRSVLKFRVMHRHLKLGHKRLCIRIVGKYYGENTHTLVTVNGRFFGEQRLVGGNREITVCTEDLPDYEVIDIQLQHMAPVSPREYEGKKDARNLAFLLMRIGCIPLDQDTSGPG